MKKVQRFFPLLTTKMYIIVGIVSAYSMFMFSHCDPAIMTSWWTTLIECIPAGNFSEYQTILFEINNPTNYPLFLNVLFSICMLPIYIFLHIFHLESHLKIYILWLKFLIILLNLGVAKVIQLILKENKIAEHKQIWVSFLYLVSPFVQLYSIGMGQIDVCGLFFAMLCFLSIQQKKHIQFVLFAALSISMKPFVIFIIAPLFIYVWHYNKKISILASLITIAWYITQGYFSNLIVKDYSSGNDYINSIHFYHRIMNYQLWGVPFIIFPLFFICLLFLISGYFKKLSLCDTLLCQCILLLIFETLLEQNSQWYIYLAGISVMFFAFSWANKPLYYLFWIFEIFFSFSGLYNFNMGNMVYGFLEGGLLGNIISYGGFSPTEIIREHIPTPDFIFQTILSILSTIFIIYTLHLYMRHTYIKKDKTFTTYPLILSIIPSVSYILFLTICYILPIT